MDIRTMKPHIALVHLDSFPAEDFNDFAQAVRVDKLELHVVGRPSGPMAGVEWLMPSMILAYLAKPYFESFLAEMGRDHYELLKRGLKRLYGRVAGPDSPEVTLVSTAGKVRKDQPYSLLFSVVAEGRNGERIKLLIPRPIDVNEYEAAIDTFLEFVDRLHANELDDDYATLVSTRPRGGSTILVVYDPKIGKLHAVDPLAAHHRAES